MTTRNLDLEKKGTICFLRQSLCQQDTIIDLFMAGRVKEAKSLFQFYMLAEKRQKRRETK